MVKRTLIAIIVVALLASATRASIPVPICNVPVYMYVDGEVEKFYFDCEKFEVEANFNAKLSLSIDVIDPEFTDWDLYFDGGDTVPGDGYWHTLKVCVWTYKPKQPLGDPGSLVKIGTVTISAMPTTVDEAMSVVYYIQVKNPYDHKFVLQQYVDIDIKTVETALFIMDEVDSGNIAPELEGSLLVKIDAALAALDRGNPNDAKVAMNNLKALINQVEAQTGKKITAEAAAEIIQRVNEIIAVLGG